VFTLTGTSVDGCTDSETYSLTVSPCTGIENYTSAEGVSVYPNPFSSELTIKDFTGKADVYNAIGQLVLSHEINGQENINTLELAKGAYMIKLSNTKGEAVKTIKMMKN